MLLKRLASSTIRIARLKETVAMDSSKDARKGLICLHQLSCAHFMFYNQTTRSLISLCDKRSGPCQMTSSFYLCHTSILPDFPDKGLVGHFQGIDDSTEAGRPSRVFPSAWISPVDSSPQTLHPVPEALLVFFALLSAAMKDG